MIHTRKITFIYFLHLSWGWIIQCDLFDTFLLNYGTLWISEQTLFTVPDETEAGTACDHIILNSVLQDRSSPQIVSQKEEYSVSNAMKGLFSNVSAWKRGWGRMRNGAIQGFHSLKGTGFPDFFRLKLNSTVRSRPFREGMGAWSPRKFSK